jgi:hypothetical protein
VRSEFTMPDYYCLCVKGQIGQQWSDWFDGLTIDDNPDGCTMLTGLVEDQAALHGILARLYGLNLALISVSLLDAETAASQIGR